MAEIAGAIAYAVKDVAESAVLLAKGIYDPTLPLIAKLKPLKSVNVPLAYHTVSEIKGRAYLFGGKTVGEDGQLKLAPSDVHIVILPTSDLESLDYKKIEADSNAPPQRSGHSAAVIDERIYVFGGCGEDGEPLEENGRVWIFDTTSNKWSYLDSSGDGRMPGDGQRPDGRSSHGSVASEHPRHIYKHPGDGMLPQDPPDPEITIPEIDDPSTYGTVIIQGGRSKSGATLHDIWTFDISTKKWAELPEPPPPSSNSPSLTNVERRLYTFTAGQTSFLDLTSSRYDDEHGKGELGLAPLGPWQSLQHASASSPEVAHPGERTNAALVPVTTGQGRNYLLLIGGQSQSGETLEDIWSLQLKPEGMTAASFKDAARGVIKKDTGETHWDEVKYHNEEGVLIQEGQPGRGISIREGFAAAKGSDVDGASLVLWGGLGADGKPRGDGLMITVDR